MSPHRAAPKPKTALSLHGFHALFPDEAAARAWFEQARWPNGIVCPRCAAHERASWMRTRDRWVCLDCKQQYSVMSFTPMHRSHLPLLVWAQAIYLMVSSSKGISSLKLSEMLGISYKAAWHLTQRIRAMMAADVEAGAKAGRGGHGPLLQGLVEIDETYAGAPPRKRAASDLAHVHVSGDDTSDDSRDDEDLPPPPSGGHKTGRGTSRPMVLVAVERGAAKANGAQTSGRSVAKCLPTHSRSAIAEALDGVLDGKATVFTDGLPAYRHLDASRGGSHAHHTVFHSQRVFARSISVSEGHDRAVEGGHALRAHVNTAESWFAVLHRAVVGVFHHLSSKHLDRYASEAAFRWNARASHVIERMRKLVAGSFGARLTFKDLVGSSVPSHGTMGLCQ